jgi:hypothetical protein
LATVGRVRIGLDVPEDQVTVGYTGWSSDGRMFDSTLHAKAGARVKHGSVFRVLAPSGRLAAPCRDSAPQRWPCAARAVCCSIA